MHEYDSSAFSERKLFKKFRASCVVSSVVDLSFPKVQTVAENVSYLGY